MKLNETKPYVETSGDLEEQFFSIQDQGMIFDILRNKMYSNPILAICREISCNARDAHREVGNEETPVQIVLPNNLEPTYKIRDFGPGISPNRMSNIFIKYTASTKRSDNLQTGGFGLGAKTPFSYSDTFSIVTNVDGTQYNYSCFIDETKVGKLALLSEAPTNEPNGTTIIIPVKPADFNFFRDYTEQATRHWKVRPEIKGASVPWKDVKPILSGNNWLIGSSSHSSSSYNYDRDVKLIIDGVEYPLDVTTLRKYADSKVIDSVRGSFYLYFGVGELSLSASREQVYLDDSTQRKISERLSEVAKDLKKNASDKIEQFTDYWKANCFYRKELNEMFSNLDFLGKLSWKGYDLHNHYVDAKCDIFSFAKGGYSRKGTDPNKLRRSRGRNIQFYDKSKLVLNDLSIKEPTPRHVKKLFEDNPDFETVQVICLNDKVTLQDLNNSIHLDQMNYVNLSSLTKASGRAYKPSANRLLVFKFDAGPCMFRQVSYASVEEDENEIKVLCRLTKDPYSTNNRTAQMTNGQTLHSETFNSLLKKFPNLSIYGLDVTADKDRIAEDFSDFIDLEEFIKEKIIKDPTIDFLKLKYASSQHYHLSDRLLRGYNIFIKKVEDPNSVFLKKIKINKELQSLSEQSKYILHVYELFDHFIDDNEVKDWLLKNKDYDLEAINTECSNKYPLLDHINTYHIDHIVEQVTHYINLSDK